MRALRRVWRGSRRRGRRDRLPPLFLGLALLAPACTPLTSAATAPPPMPGRDLTDWTTASDGRHVLYLRNDSDAVYRVRAVVLRDCQNLAEPCGRHEVDRVLCPGQAAALLTLNRVSPEDRVWFGWSYEAARFADPVEAAGGC